MLWGVDNMLHAVENHWARGADVQQPFDPQDAFAVGMQQHAEPDAKRDPIEWLSPRSQTSNRADLVCDRGFNHNKARRLITPNAVIALPCIAILLVKYHRLWALHSRLCGCDGLLEWILIREDRKFKRTFQASAPETPIS